MQDILATRPMLLPANNFEHFYEGGASIARFRGLPVVAGLRRPEDWIASTTTRFGDASKGLSALPDGRLLRDAVSADPVSWLGNEHVLAYGADTGLLVKLLDVEKRLIVHTHPDRDFARRHLGCAHGKTEAWVILETTVPDPVVYVGFREAVGESQLAEWVREQRTDEMLAALNELPVRVGDVILVPAGVPHAIGAGVFIAEVQEPTDFSLTLEWRGFAIDGQRDGHLGLGFDLALQSVDRSAWPASRLAKLRGPADDGSACQELLPPVAAPFFRIQRTRGGAQLDASFAIALVIAGAGRLVAAESNLALHSGHSAVVPFGAGASLVEGDVTMLRFLPPAPQAGSISTPLV